MTTYIYALRCPVSGQIRYIGKSLNPERRLLGHLTNARTGSSRHHTANWLRKIEKAGLKPTLEILETVASGDDWRNAERRWIGKGIAEEWPLTNSTAGGEGLDYLWPEDKARYLERKNAAMAAYRTTPEGQAQLRRMIAGGQTPEARARNEVARLAAIKSQEYSTKMSVSSTEVWARPGVKEKSSASLKRMWQDPAKREHYLKVLGGEECKKKQSASAKRSWADPELGAKLRAIHTSEEVRAKKSEAAKNRATPEYRAMMAEKTRLSWEKRRKNKGA